jgi:hypothetical protein
MESYFINDELERMWKKNSNGLSTYYPDIWLEGLRKSINNLSGFLVSQLRFKARNA